MSQTESNLAVMLAIGYECRSLLLITTAGNGWFFALV